MMGEAASVSEWAGVYRADKSRPLARQYWLQESNVAKRCEYLANVPAPP
jgi:hypothetical protein